MTMRRRLLNLDWMLTSPIRFLVCDIILFFVPEADIAYVFSKMSRLIANFCIIAVILTLAVDQKDHRMGAGQRLFSLVACTLLVAPLAVTIGFNARYHVAWEAQDVDTLSYWRKYAISDASFCALYLLITVEILLWAVVTSLRRAIPRRVCMTARSDTCAYMKQQAICFFVLIVPELLVSAGVALVIAVEYRVLNPDRHSVSIIVKLIRD